MRVFTFIAGLFFVFTCLTCAQAEKPVLPENLQITYANFIKAMKTGDSGEINEFCLPQAVSFSYEKRKNTGFGPGYGQDINIYWAKNGFDGEIITVRKEAENCYLIRSATTAMWFVETTLMEWKLYRYLDKPIE